MSTRDREATFRRLYQAHYRGVAAYAQRRLGAAEAEDAVAETFTVAWRRAGDIPEGDLAAAWLYGVARRVISQGMRGRGRRRRLFTRLASIRRQDETVASVSDTLGDRELVRLALGQLRDKDRELLLAAEWDGLDAEQLAAVFGCSPNAAAIRLHRARHRFRQTFARLDAEIDAAPRGTEPA